MTAAAAFLARILAEPAEDTHRLVFADYLDEQDDRVPCPECEGRGSSIRFMRATDWFRGKRGPSNVTTECPACNGSRSVPAGNAARAEFVRCQIELAKHEAIRVASGKSGWRTLKLRTQVEALRARESALLRVHGTHWLKAAGITPTGQDGNRFAGYLIPGGPVVYDVRFGRGFVEAVAVPTLAEFVGDRACEACRGDGTYLGMPRSSNPGLCSRCSGLGRVRACPGECHDGWVNLEVAYGTEREHCSACSGSGTLPALAPRLARVPGIATVEIGDRVPELDRIWYRAGRPDPYPGIPESAELPPLLFDLLDGYNVDKELDPEVTPGRWKSYPDLALATSALAQAGGGLLAGLRLPHPEQPA